MNAYRKDFDESKCITFKIKNNELLKKYKEIWEKVSNAIKKEFNIDPVYNKKYLKTRIKSYKRQINTNFHLKFYVLN